jgi:hypothetical protein
VITYLDVFDRTRLVSTFAGSITRDRRIEETYDGQRHATGTQTVRYRATGNGCYDHTLTAMNGYYTKDFYRC